MVALNANTGAALFNSSIGSIGYLTSPVVANGVIYIIKGNMFFALNATTGATLWSYANGNGFTSPTVVNGMVYVGSADSTGYHVDAFHLPKTAL